DRGQGRPGADGHRFRRTGRSSRDDRFPQPGTGAALRHRRGGGPPQRPGGVLQAPQPGRGRAPPPPRGRRMTSRPTLAERWGPWPAIAFTGALALLIAGVLMGLVNEATYRFQRTRELAVQADILGRSVSAALAFQDRQAAQEYVDALGANPEIETAGVYDEKGELIARYGRAGHDPP